MDQAEIDEVMRLARIAVHAEDAKRHISAQEMWRNLMNYVLLEVALPRVQKAVAYERENPGVL